MIFLTCISCFLSGFLTGVLIRRTAHFKSEKKRRTEIEKIREEFKNFLEYDGSVQG